jgi:predicted MPP superfamily phosphohydrolase
MFGSHPLPFVLVLLLFGVTCLGHLALMVRSHNWWYGQRMPKRAGDVAHLVHALLVAAFPVLLYALCGWDLTGTLAALADPQKAGWQAALGAYIVLCLATALVLVPAITLQRCLRREPVLEMRAEVVDVAKHLGYVPVGEGKQRRLALLPGNEVFQVELVQRTLALPRLPAAWDGLTILHLSDLHLNGIPDRNYFRYVIERCNSWEPDLVAVTGDIADSYHHQRWIVPVLGRLRWRLAGLAILGNHDHWYDVPHIRRRLRRVGLRVLANTWEQLDIRGKPLVVIGHEGPWLRPAPDLSACPDGPFRLCLSHTPDNIRWARRAGVDLMLSGHVHGGQIRFPVLGSLLVPSRYGRRYDCGTFDEAGTVLHVSRGLSGEHPLRYGCRPEATLLTLRRPAVEKEPIGAHL